MTAGPTKKAMVVRFDRDRLTGFVDGANPFQGDEMQLLSPEGAVQQLKLEQIKALCFVREWFAAAPWTRNYYAVRPRQQGLWVRLHFRDGDKLEATMQNSIAVLDPVAIAITPPETISAVQRVLVPRISLEGFEILGVIGSPLKKKTPAAAAQLKMFE